MVTGHAPEASLFNEGRIDFTEAFLGAEPQLAFCCQLKEVSFNPRPEIHIEFIKEAFSNQAKANKLRFQVGSNFLNHKKGMPQRGCCGMTEAVIAKLLPVFLKLIVFLSGAQDL